MIIGGVAMVIFLVFGTIVSFLLFLPLIGGRVAPNSPEMAGPFICVFIFVIVAVVLINNELDRKKNKGRECRAFYMEGLPDFEREQRLRLTLDVKNRIILMDGLKELNSPSQYQTLTRLSGLKTAQVALRLQQITKLSYIDWEGEISRWVPGSSGYSYPGIFEGTRHYVPPTEGYFKTEMLRVNRALEIRYQNQSGVPSRIVLDISKDTSYAEALLESLCRCTRLPAPQYVPPVKAANPGPTYL